MVNHPGHIIISEIPAKENYMQVRDQLVLAYMSQAKIQIRSWRLERYMLFKTSEFQDHYIQHQL
jgi:uncharacterized protein (AIM24 family)